MNPLKQLETLGQSVWLDYLKRDFIREGKLKQLIENDGLRGVTSNPSIFEKAISQGKEYTDDIVKMKETHKNEVQQILDTLTYKDIQDAADVFKDQHIRTQKKDGYVSLEVNPHLAYDTEATIIDARRLWHGVNRKNVMIKVPATPEGILAIQQLISEGININITLIFGLDRYQAVWNAYLTGLESRLSKEQPLANIASVASFFLSRIDVLLDPLLEKIIEQKSPSSSIAKELLGQVAISSAKMAYQIYQYNIEDTRYQHLKKYGATPQRLLWASTSTKNPHYSDIQYVEPLIGPETINTMPLETLEAYRDHGNPKLSLEQNVEKANWVFQKLPELGIDMGEVTKQLEKEGVQKFIDSFEKLIYSLKGKLNE